MRMQCRPSSTYDAEASVSAASLFSSLPQSLLHPFPSFFQHKTGMTIVETWSVGYMDFTNRSVSFGAGAECSYDVWKGGGDKNAEGEDCNE